MSFLNHLSVRNKVTASFALVLLACVALGAFSYERIMRLNAVSQDIRSNWFPGMLLLAKAERTAQRARINEALATMASAPADRDGFLREANEQMEAFRVARAEYQTLIGPGAEAELASAVDALWASYGKTHAELEARLHASHRADAVALFTTEATTTFKALRNAMTKLIEFNALGGQAVADQGGRWARARGAGSWPRWRSPRCCASRSAGG
jgi:methyl-accepting chemotaxis protein